MAIWKVTREVIRLFPHPNESVTKLELGKAGQYQVVVGKGIFKDGSTIIFVPEKSVLPAALADEGDRRKYLAGPEKNRVKAVTLQKELSMGIIFEDRPEYAHIPLGEDISTQLGITKWEAPIPDELKGKVVSYGDIDAKINRHEVEIFNIYPNELQPGEPVIVTEKLCGTQGVYCYVDGKSLVTTKGLIAKDQYFAENEENAYTRAGANSRIFDILKSCWPGQTAQAFAEVLPFISGFNYGFKDKSLRVFRVDIDGRTIPYDDLPDAIKALWVPILYRGPFDLNVIRPLKEGKETVSGKELHIKEGIVVSPVIPRRASMAGDKFRLYLKLLNSKYSPADDDIS